MISLSYNQFLAIVPKYSEGKVLEKTVAILFQTLFNVMSAQKYLNKMSMFSGMYILYLPFHLVLDIVDVLTGREEQLEEKEFHMPIFT